jgi:hypothetical protein
LIELFVLHCWGFLSPAIVPSPTEMPDGPKNVLSRLLHNRSEERDRSIFDPARRSGV